MKLRLLLLTFMASALTVQAQRTPSHPLDIKQGFNSIFNDLDSWEPGQPPAGTDQWDDQFYIGRVRPLPRLSRENDYYVRSDVKPDRKLIMWTPLDDPSTQWKSLPRYIFEGDNYNMWQYTDIHGNWTAPWFRVTAGIMDAAHKNGTSVGCVYAIPYGVGVYYNEYGSDHSKNFYRLMERDDEGQFKYATKVAKLLKYYGIDGFGCNSEFVSNAAFMESWMDFVKAVKAEAAKIGWHFEVHWYDGTNDTGAISFDKGLASHNDGIFGRGGAEVTDALFFNYNWNGTILSKSATYAQSMGRSSYDLYAGFDIQKSGFRNNYWASLLNSKISIGLWGAHAQNLLHQSATDYGSTDIAIQQAYKDKLELVFSGGYRNPAVSPTISTTSTLGNASLANFHGLARFITAKSTLQQLPFVTRFNLGNGLSFRNKGHVTFNHKWYNLGTQDFLPTWRWWITDATDNAPSDGQTGLVKAELTFDDAYFGGSCLKLSGASAFSRVKLFKTHFMVHANNELSVTYKVLNGTAPRAKVFVARKGQLTQYLELGLPEVPDNEWHTAKFSLGQLGVVDGDIVAMLGVSVENTPADYNLLIGEMKLVELGKNYGTVAPTITKVDVLRRRYNAVDFKLFYKSRDESNGEKTYNDEVGTWYFEVWMQQEGEPEQLLTATPSWAAYVIDAPLKTKGSNRVRFGVRAVAPDGSDAQAVQWSEWQDVPYDTPLEDVVADRPIIKPNEEFSLRYLDELHVPATLWRVVDPVTNEEVARAENSTSITLSIAKEGLYDLYVTDNKGKETITRGFVQITPVETGAVPRLQDFTADKTEVKADEDVHLNYTSIDGEGTVSRSLRLNDPNMFMVPAAAQQGKTYSVALWFKVNKFSHDKQGTNLINKNTVADEWPHNNWGDFWVVIRPETQEAYNEVAYNTMGWEAHDRPNPNMKSTGYSVTPNVWNHIVVTQRADGTQTMYFNGKQVAQTMFGAYKRREDLARTDRRVHASTPANIFFGGGNVYKAAFDGWIDEVQIWDKELSASEIPQVMKGYKTAPEHLVGYYTFEERLGTEDAPYFANMGRGNGQDNMDGKVVVMSGSGGENTSNAAYEVTSADNEATGYPGLTGSLPIVTKPTWTADEGKVTVNEDKSATVSFLSKGSKNVKLEIANMWGSDSKEKVEYILVTTTSTGVKQAETSQMKSYTVGRQVVVQFASAGQYTVEVCNAAGSRVAAQTVSASEGEQLQLSLHQQGVYILRVLQGGKAVHTSKLICQ